MELRLLPLISYLAAGTYLMAWIIRRSWSLNVWIRDWWIRRQAAGRVQISDDRRVKRMTGLGSC